MDWEETVLSDEEYTKIEEDFVSPDDDNWLGKVQDAVAKAQAEKSYKAGVNTRIDEDIARDSKLYEDGYSAGKKHGHSEGKKDGRRGLIEWGDDICPHGTLTADTSVASKRECGECWQTLLKELEGA